jgi:hypothetical protein
LLVNTLTNPNEGITPLRDSAFYFLESTMILKFKTWGSFKSILNRFPSIELSDLPNTLKEIDSKSDSRIVALSDRVITLSKDRKIIARDKIPAEKLVGAS